MNMKKHADCPYENKPDVILDHLEGVLFIDHLSRLKRNMILNKLAKQRKVAA